MLDLYCSRNFSFAILLCAHLLTAPAFAETGSLAPQITLQEQKLAQARASGDWRAQATELNSLANLYWQSGQLPKGLDYCNQALALEQFSNLHTGEAFTKNIMARIYTDMGQAQKALDLLNETLPFWQSSSNQRRARFAHEEQFFKVGLAFTLSNLGRVYNQLGDQQKALDYLNRALPIWQDSGSARGQANALEMIGRTYADMGQGQMALDSFNRALPLWRQDGDEGGEALTLNEMGPAYAELGQKQKALESYDHALSMWREIGNRQGEAATLDNMGWLYRDLGQHQTALDYYNQALPIWREVGNRSGEARALSDLGRAYADLHQPAKALDYPAQALPIFRDTGNLRGQAMALNNMGRDQFDLGEPKQALDLDLQALALWRAAGDKRGEAIALMTIAWSYAALKDPDTSFSAALAALGLAKSIGDPETEGFVENSIMLGFRRQQRPEEAIFFGLLAVNSYEQIRKNISGLVKEVQAGFAQSKAQSYRSLAELLIETGRLGQAEQILDLVKEQEFKDLVTGAASTAAPSAESLKLSPAQQQAESQLPDLELKAQALEEASLAFTQLQAKPPGAGDDAQLKSLDATMQQLKNEIESAVDKKLFPELDAQSTPGHAVADTSRSFLQDSLAKLGSRVIGIRLLLGEDHAYAIVVTANARKVIVLPASSADLRIKAFDALKALSSPSSDPRPQLSGLYTSIVVAPLEDQQFEKHLAPIPGPQYSVPALLWSLDDALRYVPMGSLYDGKPLYGRALSQCSLHSRELPPHRRLAASKQRTSHRIGHGTLQKLRRPPCASRRDPGTQFHRPRPRLFRFAWSHAGPPAVRRAIHPC